MSSLRRDSDGQPIEDGAEGIEEKTIKHDDDMECCLMDFLQGRENTHPILSTRYGGLPSEEEIKNAGREALCKAIAITRLAPDRPFGDLEYGYEPFPFGKTPLGGQFVG